MIKNMLKICILVSTLFSAGCGGSVNESGPAAMKYVQLTFSLISSSQPRVGIYSVELTLPQGVSVPIKAGTANELESTTIYGSNGVYATGSYSAATNRISFGATPTGTESIAYSSFVVINCPLSSSANSLGINDFPYSMSGATFISGSTTISDIKARSRLDVKFK